MTRMQLMVGVLSMLVTQGKTIEKNLESVEFSNLTLKLNWDDHETDLAHLDDKGYCIYEGHVEKDSASSVLVTGCEDVLSIQIQSTTFGDHFFSSVNGSIQYVEISEGDFDHDYEEVYEYESPFGVVAQENGRVKRGTEFNYYDSYDDEPIENPEFDKNYPDLSDAEVVNLEYPEKLNMNINVYLDKHWYFKFGKGGSIQTANRVLTHAKILFQHKTLNTKIDLKYGDRIYKSTAPTLKPSSRGYKKLGSHLKSPYDVDGYAVAHLHLTADYNRPTPFPGLGKAKLASMCDTKSKPRALVKYGSSELRTAMTVAHELGHVLGMHHDFKDRPGKRGTCGKGKNKGGVVMNYGSDRNAWSNCSNSDFKEYYSKVVVHNREFCLMNPNPAGCKCRGKMDLAGGNCSSEAEGGLWCYVDVHSKCKDKQIFWGQTISFQPCRCGGRADQFQCKTGRCIPISQRCDGLVRNCPGGDDEAGCPFVDF